MQERGTFKFRGAQGYQANTWNQDTMGDYSTKVTGMEVCAFSVPLTALVHSCTGWLLSKMHSFGVLAVLTSVWFTVQQGLPCDDNSCMLSEKSVRRNTQLRSSNRADT